MLKNHLPTPKNADLLAKIGADTAKHEQNLADFSTKNWQILSTPDLRPDCGAASAGPAANLGGPSRPLRPPSDWFFKNERFELFQRKESIKKINAGPCMGLKTGPLSLFMIWFFDRKSTVRWYEIYCLRSWLMISNWIWNFWFDFYFDSWLHIKHWN